MNAPTALLHCSSCCNLRFYPFSTSSIGVRRKCSRSYREVNSVSRLEFEEKRWIGCEATRSETDTEPESNNDKDDDGELSPSIDSLVRNNGHLDSQPVIDESNVQSVGMEKLDLKDSLENNGVDPTSEVRTQDNDDNLEVTSGSPLPGVKQLGEAIKIPKATIDILKDQVFAFDTFFVTSQEPYEWDQLGSQNDKKRSICSILQRINQRGYGMNKGGVLFKGNLRGKAAKSYEKITKRMQDRFGDEYKLFLLINPEDDKPVAVVVPRKTLQPETTAVSEWFAAGAFGLATIFTLLLRNVPTLQSNLLSTFDNLGLLKDGLPGALVTAFVLGVHEVGHILVAKDVGAKLGVPYFVPSWQIGSFGAITRIVSIVSNREDLLKIAVAGPLAGFSLGLVLLLVGFILPPTDGIGIIVDAAVFHESFLAGGIAKLLLGDALKEGTPLSVNPLVIWAWAGLLINAINSIPAGELDGGRISFALWGRKASTRVTGVSIALLGLASLFNDVAFYWVVLIFFLQRGPIAPLSEEITDPENEYVTLGIAVLVLGLLVCAPYPFPFAAESMSF